MKKFRCMVDFRGKEKSWCCAREVEADSELHALQDLYVSLHTTMKCTFRIWSITEMIENPKLEENKDETTDLF